MVVLAFLKLLGCLGLLMYGTKLMGDSLQQLAGDRLRHILDSLTTNRFTSLLTGALVTAMIQSSTAASLMTVSFVHAGMLSFMQALPVLMGASVGNTLIAWLMAAELNFGFSNYIYPLMLVAFLLVQYRKRPALGESVFGFCFILLSLGLLCHLYDSMTPADQHLVARYLAMPGEHYGVYVLLLLVGAAVTFAVQSSAAIMATSMVLCSTGVWSVYAGAAFMLGENIGRAVATWQAASSAGTPARRTAFGQLAFNLVGVAWMFAAFPYVIGFLCDFVHFDPTHGQIAPDHNLAYVLAAFHTGFNLCNATLFIGLTKPLERWATQCINKPAGNDEKESELRFITKGLLDTPEESVMEARKEIINYTDTVTKMFTQTRYLFSADNETDFKNIFTLVEHYEEISDEMETDIAGYLNRITAEEDVPESLRPVICGMLRELAEIEKRYREMKVENFLKNATSIIEKLETLAVDINQIFNPESQDKLWQKYYEGDADVFVRYLARSMSRKQVVALKEEFEKNPEFRKVVSAYMNEFEELINRARACEKSDILLSVISGADVGKIYYVLARALDKLN